MSDFTVTPLDQIERLANQVRAMAKNLDSLIKAVENGHRIDALLEQRITNIEDFLRGKINE